MSLTGTPRHLENCCPVAATSLATHTITRNEGKMTSPSHRIVASTVGLTGPDGQPLANTPVTVRQVSHEFGFGNIGFDFVGLANGQENCGDPNFGGASTASAAKLAELWLGLFNQSTLPFYWRGFEPIEGEPDTQRLKVAAQWFLDRGVRTKGHPLLWHTLAPEWLLGRPLDEVERICRERIARDAGEFAGLVDHWDAINETVILPRFTAEDNAVTHLAQDRGRLEVVKLAFNTAREANPNAKLVINDFLLTDEYVDVIHEYLEAGIQIDAIGIQTHMHQGFRGEEEIAAILDKFGQFGLPMQLTETTLVSGHLMPEHIVDLNDYQIPDWPSTAEGEARQADEIVRHYRVCASHPLVESITYWGISDEGSWLGAPCGLVRTDGTAKPAYDALKDLIHEQWWLSPTELVTDAHGVVEVSGWAGEYEVSAAGANATFQVTQGATPSVQLA